MKKKPLTRFLFLSVHKFLQIVKKVLDKPMCFVVDLWSNTIDWCCVPCLAGKCRKFGIHNSFICGTERHEVAFQICSG